VFIHMFSIELLSVQNSNVLECLDKPQLMKCHSHLGLVFRLMSGLGECDKADKDLVFQVKWILV